MKTQSYKKSLSGSVGAGMKSLFGGSGRRFYTLEHKITSKYHRAGETQQIIVDQIELGRASTCQVRFDESFTTVSRRHAAIVKDGDNWKLVQLSQTNSTYLNGHKVDKEWYLQNGDEIQLSTNGPKLGFIVNQGEKGLVKSIGLTARMNLFRQQALRPYKTAIATLGCLLVLITGVGGKFLWDNSNEIGKFKDINGQLAQQIEAAERKRVRDSIENARIMEEQRIRYREEINEANRKFQEALDAAEQRLIAQGSGATGISALLEQQDIYKDVYFIFTQKVVIIENGNEKVIKDFGWGGTGFLLNDGRFVTARHCIEGWWYQEVTSNELSAQAARYVSTSAHNANTPIERYRECRIKGYYVAISSLANNKFEFTSDDFVIDHSKDRNEQIGIDESGRPLYWNFTFPAGENWDEQMWATDWAYTTNTNGQRGTLIADEDLSENLLPAQKLVVLGFPKSLGVNDGEDVIEPIFNEVTTSRKGLAANGCILHSRGTDHGNSGGPIFTVKDGKLVVVAIVSRGDVRTTEHNWAVPVKNLK